MGSRIFIFIGALALVSSCGSSRSSGGASQAPEASNSAPVLASPPTPPNFSGSSVRVQWSASKENKVNAVGGGYRVYYSMTAFSSASGVGFVDVPFLTGTQAPTSVLLTGLSPGRYYVRIQSFSALPDDEGNTTSFSEFSEQKEFTVTQ